MKYLVISFKPYAFSRAWDQTFDSRTIIKTCIDAQDAAQHIAFLDCLVDSNDSESFRHVTLTINEDTDINFDDYRDDFFDKSILPEVAVFIEGEYLARKNQIKLQKEQAKLQEEQKAREKAELTAKQKREDELALLARLKEKYEHH